MNPLMYSLNTTIPFNRIEFQHIEDCFKQTTTRTDRMLKEIIELKTENRTFKNTLQKLDDLYDELGKRLYPIYFMSSVHTDTELRKECDRIVSIFSKYMTDLSLNEDLYKAVKSYSESDDAKRLEGEELKFCEETVREFERNGFALEKSDREKLKELQNQLSDLSIAFNTNIAEVKDTLNVDETGVEGLPEDFKKSHKNEDGSYTIPLDYPSYIPFMKYSTSEQARKDLYYLYSNRAADKNIDILKKMIDLRNQMAELLGYKTYATYKVENRMVKKPEMVWNFEKKLVEKVKVKAQQDFEELLEIKKESHPEATEIYPWEKGFYNTKLLKSKYEIDPELIKTYFTLDNTIDGLFLLAKRLFAVEFRRNKETPVWHEDVYAYDVYKQDELIGHLYLDMFPRENKYSHAACFGIVHGKHYNDEYQRPVAALVCNFTKPTADRPSLLYHNDVETLFHEFGHGLHQLLTQAKLGAFAGTSVVRDYVETPSQLMENWAWSYNMIKEFAFHHESGDVMPESLFNKMLAARNQGSGIDTQQQIFYGLIDMTLHDGFDVNGSENTTDVVRRLQKETTLFPFAEGTHFEAAFGHLDGYAAGYYGYLWSKVYAQDIFSIFEEKGLFDSESGERLRDEIFIKGGSVDELSQVQTFLQREPNEDAFIRSLGV